MKHGPLLAAALLTVTFFNSDAAADVYTVRRVGGNIVPVKSADVSMDAEDVLVERAKNGYSVSATFVMRSHSDRGIESLMAFPIIGTIYTRDAELNEEFHVEIKNAGEPESAFSRVKAEVRVAKTRTVNSDYFAITPPKIIGDYPEVVVWDVAWEPRQTKVIRVRFDMGEPMRLLGSNEIARGQQLMYVVTTGSLWKGPIGTADITIRFTFPDEKWTDFGTLRRVSYPDHAKRDGLDLVSWHFENWTPTEEIWVRSADWNGLPLAKVSDYSFILPEYRGYSTSYSEKTIDDLVARDLELAREYFPDEVKAFDRSLLKIAIADWLLHEIYARHGDPFYIGKESPALPIGDGRIGDGQGNLFSSWNNRFSAYGWKNGWYRPDLAPTTVKTASLSPQEQKNVRFLRAYLEKLRSDPRYQKLREEAHTPGVD